MKSFKSFKSFKCNNRIEHRASSYAEASEDRESKEYEFFRMLLSLVLEP